MPHLDVSTNYDNNPWDLPKDAQLHTLEKVARLPRGMQSGKSALFVLVKLNDGSVVAAQTSLACFVSAAFAVRAAAENEGEFLLEPSMPSLLNFETAMRAVMEEIHKRGKTKLTIEINPESSDSEVKFE